MEGTKAAARKEAEEKRLDDDAVAAAPAAAAPGTSLDGAFTQVHRLKVESLSEFKVLGGLGTGATATVILARHCRERHLYAVKIFSKANVDVERVLEVGGTKWNVTLELERLQAERRILERLRTEGGDASAAPPLFPFIAHCHAALQSRTCLCFVLEFAAGGDLLHRLEQAEGGAFSEPTARFWAAELVLALDHLHSMGIAFKDLKLENVMLSSDGHVKLVDFGMAQDGLEPHSHGLGDEEVSAARGGASSATENGQKKPRPPQPMEPAVSHAIARGAFLLLHCVVCCSALLLLLGHQTKKSVKVSPHPCLPQIMLSVPFVFLSMAAPRLPRCDHLGVHCVPRSRATEEGGRHERGLVVPGHSLAQDAHGSHTVAERNARGHLA